MTERISYILLLFTIFIWGCSTTKRIADGEALYTGVKKMKIESIEGEKIPSAVRSAVEEPLSVKPNNPLYSPYIRTPLPIGLWVYNYFYTEKQSGLKHWIYQRFAKAPILISDVKPETRTQLATQILADHGYFGAQASYELHYKKNPKKARISYFVNVPRHWEYNTVSYPENVCDITKVIDSLRSTSLIHEGSRFDIDTLDAERIRITNILRNESYYYFRPQYLEYQADTTVQRYLVDLKMILVPGIPDAARQPYKIGNVDIKFYNPQGGERDSIWLDGKKVVFDKPLKIRQRLLARSVTLNTGDPSRVDDINTTMNNLTKLGIFRYVTANVTPLDSLKGADNMDIEISAAFDAPLEAELEADFSSKSNSFIGPGLIFGVRHKNIFKGGEILSFRFNGAYEWRTGNTSSQANSGAINSYEVGFNTSLIFPRLFFPRLATQPRKFDSRTTFQLGVTLLNRPQFFTMLSFNASGTYDFQTSPYSYHTITPIKLVYNHLLRTTTEFDDIMKQNPALALSFENQFIPSASYTYTFDKPYGRNRQDRLVWQSTVISAGNIFAGLSALFGSGSGTNKKLFGTTYSQFIKGTTELKYYQQVGRFNTLAYRIFTGVGYPYGNSKVLPYNEQFYIGGANSIRAFTVRSLGPGSYRPATDDNYGYFDQTGQFKLEANIEYRFRILGNLNGAVFMDAGNVWLIKKDEDRPGSLLNFRDMWDQIALGTGAGLRFDISYLVLRLDLGIGIHTPYESTKKGYYNIERFKDGLGLHLAIGYPF